MAFTAQELENISNAALDYHIKSEAFDNTIQERPLLKKMMAGQKTFPGGKEYITKNVKGVRSTTIQGFSDDDTVTYTNPANIKQAKAKWYEVHAGIKMTLTELKKDGISVVDSVDGKSTSQHTDAEMTRITSLLQDKLEDMTEGYADGMQDMFWRDGTQDSKVVPGVLSIILDDPTAAGNTLGLDRVANTWWRNRASLLINSSTASNQNLVNTLQQEFRQLRRYGGRPDTFLAGSDFMDAFEKELRALGNYTLDGWAKNGVIDAAVADIAFKGITIEYDPTLDDLSRSKYGYVIDSRHLMPYVMDGEDKKTHNPARPAEKYVVYRAMTWTGGLIADQLNCHGVYSIA